MIIHFVAGLTIGMILATLTITHVLCKEDNHGRK